MAQGPIRGSLEHIPLHETQRISPTMTPCTAEPCDSQRRRKRTLSAVGFSQMESADGGSPPPQRVPRLGVVIDHIGHRAMQGSAICDAASCADFRVTMSNEPARCCSSEVDWNFTGTVSQEPSSVGSCKVDWNFTGTVSNEPTSSGCPSEVDPNFTGTISKEPSSGCPSKMEQIFAGTESKESACGDSSKANGTFADTASNEPACGGLSEPIACAPPGRIGSAATNEDVQVSAHDLARLDDPELLDELGRGSFGRVFKCRWQGKLVAVKIKGTPRDVDVEIEVLKALAHDKSRHRGILQLLGWGKKKYQDALTCSPRWRIRIFDH